jgi:hypothetical protein
MSTDSDQVEYFNMDNGGKTFKILITYYKDEIHVKVFVATYHKDFRNVDYDTQIMDFKAKSVLIGEGVDNNMTRYSGGVNEGDNAFIFEINDLEYIYIGVTIYKFETSYKLVKLYSALGNSSVVYPWAIDTKNNYYLMEGEVYIQNSKKLRKFMNDKYDGGCPYRYYYDGVGETSVLDTEVLHERV